MHLVKLTVKLVELVLNGEEKKLPMTDRVVIVSLNYATGYFVSIFSTSEEIEVGTQIVVLNFKHVIVSFFSFGSI